MKAVIRTIGAVALLGIGGIAQADIYIGGGGYVTSIDAAATALQDDGDFAPAIFLGWRPLEMVGVELGYYDLGSYDTGGGGSVDASALGLAGLLSMELGPVGVYLKGGLASTEITAPGGYNETNSDPFGGLGLTFDLMDKLYVYGEALRFSHDDADIDVIGAGVRYTF